MVQKQDNRYTDLVSFAEELHNKNKRRIKASGWILILLPVVLGLIRWMTDSDKTVFLIIWVLCMFVVSAYLVSIEYLDQNLYERLKDLTGSDEEYEPLVGGLEIILPVMRKKSMGESAPDAGEAPDVGEAPDAVEAPEEGGDE